MEAVEAHLDEFSPFVLDGVTGSGKTEVYLRLIETVVARGRQALVLIPEIGLTPQLLARFHARLSCRVAALHSGLSDGERLSSWTHARNGTADVLVGTRSAVFVPLARARGCSSSTRSTTSRSSSRTGSGTPRATSRWCAPGTSAPRWCSAARPPSLEALDNVRRGRYRRLELPHRAGGASPPRIDVVDLRSRPFDNGLCDVLVEALEETKARSEQALLFINRRGYAPVLMCHACGWVANCERCDARLVFHREDERLRCHHCGAERPPVVECPECGSTNVRRLGLGTERVARARWRGESRACALRGWTATRPAGADRWRRCSIACTPARSMRWSAPRCLRRGITSRTSPSSPSWTPTPGCSASTSVPRSAWPSCCSRSPGGAGRGDRTGRVLLQTHNPEHPLLRVLLCSRGTGQFCAQALEERRSTRLPPFASLALVRAEAPQREAPQSFLSDAEACASARPQPGVSVLGPVPSPMERRAGRYRAQLLVDATSRRVLQRFLPGWIEELESLPSARKVRWSVDVDPQEMV